MATTQDQAAWRTMYLGAFAALRVSNTEMTKDLAALTRSGEECIEAIDIMRRAPAGDRVWPALEYLRKLRAVAP